MLISSQKIDSIWTRDTMFLIKYKITAKVEASSEPTARRVDDRDNAKYGWLYLSILVEV